MSDTENAVTSLASNQPTTSSLDLQIREVELQAKKLQLVETEQKINELLRPEYRRPTFWLGVSAAVAAFLGIVAQGTISSVKSENAELKIQRAASSIKESDEKRLRAETQEKAARQSAQKANDAAAAATHAAKAAGKRRDEALAAEEMVWNRLNAARPYIEEADNCVEHLSGLIDDDVRVSTIRPQILQFQKAMQSARRQLYYLSLTFEDAANTHEKPTQRTVLVSSNRERLSVYICAEKDWELLRQKESLYAAINDEDRLLKMSVIANETPFRTQLMEGVRYAFVIHGKDRYLVELITIPLTSVVTTGDL